MRPKTKAALTPQKLPVRNWRSEPQNGITSLLLPPLQHTPRSSSTIFSLVKPAKSRRRFLLRKCETGRLFYLASPNFVPPKKNTTFSKCRFFPVCLVTLFCKRNRRLQVSFLLPPKLFSGKFPESILVPPDLSFHF